MNEQLSLGRTWSVEGTPWWTMTPTDHEMVAALDRWDAGDSIAGRTRYMSRAPWVGYLGEDCFRVLLAEHFDGEVTPHGGVDLLPDVEVAELGVALKTRVLDDQLRASPALRVYIDDEDWRRHEGEHYFFCCWESGVIRMLFLGGVARDYVAEHAREHRVGREPWCTKDCRSLGVRELIAPLVWLGEMGA